MAWGAVVAWLSARMPIEGMVVQSHLLPFQNFGILCLLEQILKAGGPFYLVSMPVEVKDPTHGVNV